jgi:hypothetical protein
VCALSTHESRAASKAVCSAAVRKWICKKDSQAIAFNKRDFDESGINPISGHRRNGGDEIGRPEIISDLLFALEMPMKWDEGVRKVDG